MLLFFFRSEEKLKSEKESDKENEEEWMKKAVEAEPQIAHDEKAQQQAMLFPICHKGRQTKNRTADKSKK